MIEETNNETKPYKLRAPEELLAYIANLGKQYNRSMNQLMVEILTIYAPFWEEAEKNKFETIRKQRVSSGSKKTITKKEKM
jgi:hypothetical protein